MTVTQKTPRKHTLARTSRIMKKTGGTKVLSDVMGPRQLKRADELLTRIEKRGEELSQRADRLLRRVS